MEIILGKRETFMDVTQTQQAPPSPINKKLHACDLVTCVYRSFCTQRQQQQRWRQENLVGNKNTHTVEHGHTIYTYARQTNRSSKPERSLAKGTAHFSNQRHFSKALSNILALSPPPHRSAP